MDITQSTQVTHSANSLPTRIDNLGRCPNGSTARSGNELTNPTNPNRTAQTAILLSDDAHVQLFALSICPPNSSNMEPHHLSFLSFFRRLLFRFSKRSDLVFSLSKRKRHISCASAFASAFSYQPTSPFGTFLRNPPWRVRPVLFARSTGAIHCCMLHARTSN